MVPGTLRDVTTSALTERSAAAAAQRFWELGSRVHDLGTATLVAHPDAPRQPLATHLRGLRPRDRDDVAGALQAAAVVTGTSCRRVVADDRTPGWALAHLVGAGWGIEHELHLVLPADREVATGRRADVRPHADDGESWSRLRRLFRLDHCEEDARAGRPCRPERDTDDSVTVRRGLAGAGVRYFVAVADDRPIGFVCSWAGDAGWGVVEDVFVHPDHRRRGVASALIVTAVAAARRDRRRPIVISADPADTPKDLYVRLGFDPVATTMSLVRADDEE